MMFNQTFSLVDIFRVGLLIFLEIALSFDNILALSLITKRLPESQRNKAHFIGLFSGFLLRALGIACAAYFIYVFWIQCLGGLYLIYLSLKHLLFASKEPKIAHSTAHFWKVLVIFEFTDLVFALDSILAGLALIEIPQMRTAIPPKIWIVYLGAFIGMIVMRIAVRNVTFLVEKFPRLEKAAHYLIGWIGLKLLVESLYKYTHPSYEFPPWLLGCFWAFAAFFVLINFIPSKKS